MRIFLYLFGMFACPIDAFSQELPWTWDCSEVLHAQSNETLDNFEITRDEKFEVTFSRIDQENWVMVGNAGIAELITIPGPGVMQFVERSPFGTINVTQIEIAGTDGVHRAVHSRHPVLLDEIFPSQWLLRCTVR